MSRKKRNGRSRGKQPKKVFPVVTGRVQMTREGFAFIIVEDGDDVFVKASKTRGALNGDTVRVTVTREKTDTQRREGEVIEIIQRSPKPFIGILHIVANQAWVLMQSRFMPYDIAIPFAKTDKERYRKHGRGQSLATPKDETGWLKETPDGQYVIHNVFEPGEDGYGRRELVAASGMKVAAVVDDWPRGDHAPTGHIVDVLGDPGENDTEMHAILAEYGLPYRFESAVANAADSISEEITAEDIKGRRDFRDILTFTIDPADAKDFDDALSFRKLENGNYEVGVHIADVTHYVRPGSVVDEEARSRGTSVYLVDRTVPMLPEKLCNKLCSLRPNEEKLTFSAVFEITPLGRIVSQWFGKTIIYSDHRFAYEEAQKIIDAPTQAHEDVPADIKDAVLTLHALASKLRKKRFAAGAISFERPEMKVEVDEKGRPVNVYQKVTKEANWLIEEFMLLANRSVAEFVATGCKGAPGTEAKGSRKQVKTFVYRVHDEPNQEKVEALRNFIGNFGYKMGSTSNGKEISKELNNLFAAAKDTPEYNAIELLSLRTMAKARYDTENLGHYGLAFKYYTHFTSPIRRYPDMLVHRLLEAYLQGGESARKDVYDKLCKHASEREVVAAEAERASIKYKLVEFMQDKVGYVFGGHVSGLTEWGMYVEVEPTMIEGMVPLRDIKSDFFEFDADHYRLVGRRTKVVYNLGDPVRIRVKKTNLEQKLLDYELIETGEEDRLYDRIEYEHGRGTSFIKGEDGSFDNVTVGINKAARKEKVRKAIQESKRKARKAGKKVK
jgi:ribonuclease R